MDIFRELKRRKVLHTLSLYAVGCWVALQVVEVLSDAGLPPGTMRHVLIAMSVGFPLVLVISWFYDISAAGMRRTPPLSPDEVAPADNGIAAGVVLADARYSLDEIDFSTDEVVHTSNRYYRYRIVCLDQTRPHLSVWNFFSVGHGRTICLEIHH